MSLVKKLAGETAIYGLSHILTRVLFFMVFAVYLTRTIPQEEYGIYADMYSYSTILLTILTFRMDTAFFRFGSNNKDANSVFTTTMIPVLLICVATLVLILPNAEHIARFLHYENSVHYITWFAWILCFDALAAMVFAKLRLESRPVRFLIYKVINVITIVALVFFLMEFLPRWAPDLMSYLDTNLGIDRKIDYVFLANLVASLVVLLAMIPEISFSGAIDKSLIKRMFAYAIPLVFVSIAANVNQAFAAPIQKFFLSKDVLENLPQVGVYAAAAKLAILLNLFTTAFNYAAEPFFFNHAHKENSREVYGQVALAFTIFSCLVTLGIVFNLDLLILILGEEYRSGQHIVPILLMAYIFLGLYYNVGIWFKLSDKTIYGAFISAIGMVITLVVSISLLPQIGTVASAYAALICYAVMVLIGYVLGQKHYPIHYDVGRIGFYLLITAGLILMARYIIRPTVDGMFPYLAVMAFIWLGFLYYVYRTDYKKIMSIQLKKSNQ